MKYVSLCLIAVLAFLGSALAQKKPVEKVVIPTPTVQCDKCKDRIEKWMAHQDGVQSINVNVKKKTATIQYLTDRTNEENLKTEIANLGYDAGDVTAEPDAYKRLPACCKKPAEKTKE